MTSITYQVIGVDPGPRPGVVKLWVRDQELRQVEVFPVLDPTTVILSSWMGLREGGPGAVWVAVERFVFSRATVRNRQQGSHVAHAMAEYVRGFAEERFIKTQFLGAGNVKPWASNARLREWGILGQCGNSHERDAARHALFMAQRNGLLPKVV